MADDASNLTAQEIVLTRRLQAPRELVFKAWTDPSMLARWWGPKGFTNHEVEAEARPGGKLRIVMRAPDGTDYPMQGVFEEVDPPSLLIFSNQAVDAAGRAVLDGRTIVTFEEDGDYTMVRVIAQAAALVPEAAAYIAGMNEGWNQTLDKLVAEFA
jgi:uncharacterized protein YndB with AHSA1/START domain